MLIDVGVQPALPPVHGVQPQQQAYTMPVEALRGLIDTGAQRTCITRRAAARAGLKPMGKVRIGNVSSTEMHNQYAFVLGAWFSSDGGPRGFYGFDPIMGVDFKDNDDFDILIGMDVITMGDLTVARDGTFEWRLP